MPKNAVIKSQSAEGLPLEINRSLPSSSNLISIGHFLWHDHFNRRLLIISGIVIVIQFTFFKIMYPFASFINADSYNYLQVAYTNTSIGLYPVGYSNFLRLFSVFSNSDTALVACQYLLLQSCGLTLVLSLFHFFKPSTFVKIVVSAFVVVNPLFLYISNYVSSDALFISLSLIWFALLLWLIDRTEIWLLIAQVIVLFLAFTVRYYGMFYPLIAILAITLSKHKLIIKMIGMLGSILVIYAFMWHTSNQYKELTGVKDFSPFSGWQLANNALYAYRYVDNAAAKPVPERFRKLDQMVRHYFDTSRDLSIHPEEMLLANTFYMWDARSPLKQYMKGLSKADSNNKSFYLWATLGPIYADYGKYLIRQYPTTFLNYYLWPNALKYFVPPVEYLGMYNMGRDTVADIAKTWFHYSTNKIKSNFNNFDVNVLNFYPVFSGILNVLFLFSLIFYVLLYGLRSKTALLLASFWLANFSFSVFASSIALRYQVFSLSIQFFFTLIYIERIYWAAFVPITEEHKGDTLQNTEMVKT